MANDGTSYTIDIDAPADNAEAAAAVVETLTDRLKNASAAALANADAVKAGEAAYKQAEATADRAALAVEKIGLAAEAQKGKLAKALEVGDTKGAARAESAIAKLASRQTEAEKKAEAAKQALSAEAASLDKLKAASAASSAEQEHLAKSLGHAQAAAKQVAEAEKHAAGSGNLGKLSGALGQLGGPLGIVGQKATAAGDAFDDLKETLGAAGPYVAVAVAIVAISTALVGAAAAATVWLVKMGGGTKRVQEIQEKFKANVDALFQGPKLQGGIKNLLDGLEKLAGLFDKDSVTGRAMAVVIDDLGGNLLNFVSSLIPKVIAGFIQLEIWILKALIAIKPYGSTILEVGEAIGAFAAVIVGVFVGAIALGIAIVAAFIALPRLLGDAFTWAGGKISEFAKTVTDFFAGFSLSGVGAQLVQGLVDGITGGGASVVNALKNVVGSGIDAAKKALGIASPSKVFAEIGAQTAAGMSGGVEGGTNDVQQSVAAMVSPPDAPATNASAPSAQGGGAGTYYITIQAPEGSAEAVIQAVRDTLSALVDGGVAQLGGAVPG